MKACTKCGLTFEDRFVFCTRDGLPLPPARDLEQAPKSLHDSPPAPMRYCPACGAEYPLNFSTCPVDGLSLTFQKIEVARTQITAEMLASELPESCIEDSDEPVVEQAYDARADSSAESGSEDDSFGWSDVPEIEASLSSVETQDDLSSRQTTDATSPITDRPQSRGAQHSVFDSDAVRERPGFRLTAIAIVAALAVLSVLGAYAIFSTTGRRSSARRASSAQLLAPDNSILVPTPQAAVEYVEPVQPNASVQPTNEPPSSRQAERREESPGKTNRPQFHAANPNAASSGSASLPVRPPAPKPVRNDESYQVPLTQAGAGLISARTVRVRSNRTPAGFRYDVTFNLRELSGRALAWERLLVSTRAASGLTRSEVIPFWHRLGGAGTLTFTVSVELRGSREDDWRGRVTMTGLGSYDSGRLLRTSFGTDVTP